MKSFLKNDRLAEEASALLAEACKLSYNRARHKKQSPGTEHGSYIKKFSRKLLIPS